MASGAKHLIWLGWLLCSPVGAFAGAWTLPQGQVWTKVTLFQQDADEWYLASPEFVGGEVQLAGSRRPYRFNGNYQSKAVFLEAVYGVTDRFDLGVQAPYLIQEYDDDTFLGSSEDSGFGDVRVFAKIRALTAPAVLTLKLGAKMPTGDFTNADGVIPVGEGQWDFDFVGQVGRSFWPLPLYANLDLGYRARMKNKDIDRDPGDEWFFNAEVGVNLSRRLLFMTKLEGLRSEASTDFGIIKNESQIKRITYLTPALSLGLSEQAALEVGLRYTLNGRNFPAGHQVTAGLSTSLNL